MPRTRHTDGLIGTERRLGNAGVLLFEAAKQGSKENLHLVLRLPGALENINYTDRYGQSPLSIAAKKGHMSCVKLLLSKGAKIQCQVTRLGQDVGVVEMTRRAGHHFIAAYLDQCLGDLQVLNGRTRALLEAEVYELAGRKDSDVRRFSSSLRSLVEHCSYDVRMGKEEGGDPIIIRAIKSGSIEIAHKLIKDFENSLFSVDPKNGSNVLHYACQVKSPLRYTIVLKCPDLLRTPDVGGVIPLHVACSGNDIVFISWLFEGILNEQAWSSEGEGGDENGGGGLTSKQRTSSLPHLPSIKKMSTFPVMKSMQSVGGVRFAPLPRQGDAATTGITTGEEEGEEVGGVCQLRRNGRGEAREDSPATIDDEASTCPLDASFPAKSRSDRDSSSERSDLHYSYDSVRSHTISTSSSTHSSFPGGGLESYVEMKRVCMFHAGSPDPSEEDSERERGGGGGGEDEKDGCENVFVNGNICTCASPLGVSDVVDMKIFRVTTDSNSILHELATQGYTELLAIILKVAEFIKHNIDFRVLTCRSISPRTPLEMAIQSKQAECLRLLLNFATNTGIMNEILGDPLLLKTAVFTGDIEIVKVLLEYGFHEGLSPAISLAVISEYGEILRLLLFFQTQVVNVLEFGRIRRNLTRTLDRGGILWEGIQLEEVNGTWLLDALSAVDSVSRALALNAVVCSPESDKSLFRQLGQDCLRYFREASAQQSITGVHYIVKITEINLSENQLTSVPPELFQMPSLQALNLTHNSLSSLPSPGCFEECMYTAPQLAKLDLDWNQLQSLPEDLFRGLGNVLSELSVQCNSLQELPPGLWVSPKLKVLKLARNNLSRLHYFSSPRYFNDTELTRRVVSLFSVSDGGVLKRRDQNEDPSEMAKLEEYIVKAAIFCQSVCASHCYKKHAARNALQEVIDVHYSRLVFFSKSAAATVGRGGGGGGGGCECYDEPCEREIDSLAANEQLPLSGAIDEDEDEVDGERRIFSNLEILDLSHNRFQELPWDLPCVAPKLTKLEIRGNFMTDMDIIHGLPTHLGSLILDENRISNTHKPRPISLPCASPLRLLALPIECGNCQFCPHCKHRTLESLTNLSLDSNLLEDLPVVDILAKHLPEDPELASSYDTISYHPYYPNLTILSLKNNRLSSVPHHLHHLTHISSLTLSHNPIVELPPEMGLMNSQNLLLLKLQGLYLKNIPQNLLEKPTPKQLLSYLKSLLQRSKPYRRIKLMVVGEGNKGKTSLIYNLTKRGKMTRFKEVAMGYNNQPLATVGVDLGDWEYGPRGKSKVTFMTWDFGGQEEYYATHQCFLSNRSLYLLIWSVKDREAGLYSLGKWLENIEGRAPSSPVLIIGTHSDSLSPHEKVKVLTQLSELFKELYVDYNRSIYTYPRIEPRCHFINCYDSRHMDALREHIYDYVIKYKAPAPRHLVQDMDPLLQQPIPESYMRLQDIVRMLARKCSEAGRIPIYTKKEYINAVHEQGFSEKLDELEQGTSFLHENGILLHYEDSSLLSDLYFLNPQWLCSMLASVVTVQEKNPFQRNGFMLVSHLRQLFNKHSSEFAFVDQFLSLMQKFEVVFILDDYRLLIPSLLPRKEADSCVVLPRSLSFPTVDRDKDFDCCSDEIAKTGHAPLCQTPHPLFVRYYLLPFVPNGFFSRVTARLMSSDIIDHLQCSLKTSLFSAQHVLNNAHWQCWRDGIVIVWNHMEIFRIAHLTYPIPGASSSHVVSNSGCSEVATLKGIEIKVIALPDEYIGECPILSSEEQTSLNRGRCLSTWILHQATTIVDSVFEDWYEAFARLKGFELNLVSSVNPCPACYKTVRQAEIASSSSPLARRFTFSLSIVGFEVISKRTVEGVKLYLFSSPFCALTLSKMQQLECPVHGALQVEEVAPDLVFSDFAPSKVVTDSKTVVLRQLLGDGGFGSVYTATVHAKGVTQDVAAKEFRPEQGFVEQDPDVLDELKAWDVYQKASLEARVMYQLHHPHVLPLIGVTVQPLRLLVELAPLGDLRGCVRKFERARVRLSRRTIQHTLIQVADALQYLHSRRIVYRDLKPDNILVLRFPLPEKQWTDDFCVFVKLADYGISKQVSPQGIRGIEGTRPYLPPEVLLHGGREAYSTKLDVYAFGMFMYYLITFMTPFENDARPITALLEDGKRPALTTKLRPHSLHMFELMCWCWSDKPQHRPSFTDVLQALRTDTFTHLLAATPITKGSDEITAAAVNTTVTARHLSGSSSYHAGGGGGGGGGRGSSGSVLDVPSSTSSSSASLSLCGGGGGGGMSSIALTGVMSLLSNHALYGEDIKVEVWYGTENGACGIAQFQKTGMTTEVVELPSKKKKYVSSIMVVLDNIWIGTVGMGLWVYNASSKQPLAMWGEEEKHMIYLLLNVEETSSILALTHKGMFVFDHNLEPSSEAIEALVPRVTVPKSGSCSLDLNEGAVVTYGGNVDLTEVWVCSQIGSHFKVLHPKDFNVLCEVPVMREEHKTRKARHMQALVADGRNFIVVGDHHFVEKWDVVLRENVGRIDCHLPLKAVHEDNTRLSRVTSMLAAGDLLYVGTGGGSTLVFNIPTMEVYYTFHAYRKPVRCLLQITPPRNFRPFIRLFSRKESNASSDNGSMDSPTFLPRSSALNEASFAATSHVRNLSSSASLRSGSVIEEPSASDRSLLISFGIGYRGVVNDSSNHPDTFNMPGETHSAVPNSASVTAKLAKPVPSVGHLLLWSIENNLSPKTPVCDLHTFYEGAEEEY